ncbi:MAG: RsmD family RNA methyltransferase, partial [Moorella sp. (in: Bacteria)]|nr:RsmD family RNA methyltransferase [Moorella sp. (in: firmicutes)]
WHLITFFTRGGERVLDPFAGVGGTLLGAALSRPPRECLGIEINPSWVEIYHRVLQNYPGLPSYPLLVGDCLEVMAGLPDNSFHFIATDPPYNTHLRRTMCTGRYTDVYANRRTDYAMQSSDPRDLANLASYEEYLAAMGRVLAACYRLLLPGRYMVIILRDAYQQGEYIFTHADIARQAREHGFLPKGDIIWYQAGTRLRPYGYPHAFVPNIVHQHILVLQKPR